MIATPPILPLSSLKGEFPMIRLHLCAWLFFCMMLSFVEISPAALITVTDNAGTKLQYRSETDLAQVALTLNLANIRAVAVADVITTSPGKEIVVAYGSPSTLEVRTADGLSVIVSRDFSLDGPSVPAGGGPTGNGPETINDLAIGECRSDLAGLEIGVASQATLNATHQGFVRVLNAATGSLADRNGTGAGLNVTAVGIADVNSNAAGGELVFCWNYQAHGATFDTQVAVFTPAAAGFVTSVVRNIEGSVRPAALAIGEAKGNGGTPEILIGTDLGSLHLFQASIVDANPGLLSYADPDPTPSLRGGFEDVKAVAIGSVFAGSSAQLATASTDGLTTTVVRLIDPTSAGINTDLAINDQLSGDVVGLRAYEGNDTIADGEVYAAMNHAGGTLLVLNSSLAQMSSKSALGQWVQLDADPPVLPNAVRSVEWAFFY
jgi:hypothetical protein